jgi:nicotinamide mononucleotide adenylyltransferase
LKYALEAKKKCEILIVGITNPDITQMSSDAASEHRHLPKENPFTFYERLLMIEAALIGAGLDRKEFKIVPFPINKPELIQNYVPKEAKYYLTITEEWGNKKKEILKNQGFDVEVLYELPKEKRGINGKDVRKAMIENKDWEKYIPVSEVKVIKENNFNTRLV